MILRAAFLLLFIATPLAGQACMGIPNARPGLAFAGYGQATSGRDGFGVIGTINGNGPVFGGFLTRDTYRDLNIIGYTVGGIFGGELEGEDGVSLCALGSVALTEVEYTATVGRTRSSISLTTETWPLSVGMAQKFAGKNGGFVQPALRGGYLLSRVRTTTNGRVGARLKSDIPFAAASVTLAQLPGFMTIGMEAYGEKGSKPLFFARIGFTATARGN